MGHRELFLTIGAIIIFSMTTFSINRKTQIASESVYNQQAQFLIYSYTQQLIQEVKTKAFDEVTINDVVTNPNDFTYPPSHNSNESYPDRFDDVDDYDNLNYTLKV